MDPHLRQLRHVRENLNCPRQTVLLVVEPQFRNQGGGEGPRQRSGEVVVGEADALEARELVKEVGQLAGDSGGSEIEVVEV